MGKIKTIELTSVQRLELEHGFRHGTSHCLRMRCRAVLLKSDGLSSVKVGKQTEMSLVSVNAWVKRFLSEGNGEAARIRGNRVRDLNKIQSEAYRQVEEIRGAADAKATEIYAKAYNQSPESVAFYEFTRTMQSYKSIIAENTTLVLSTDSDLFKFLKGMTPNGDAVPAPRSGDNR